MNWAEKPDFLPFTELPIPADKALLASMYLLTLESQGYEFENGEIEQIIAGYRPDARNIVSAVGRFTSRVAGPLTKKQRANIVDYLQMRGEQLNLL